MQNVWSNGSPPDRQRTVDSPTDHVARSWAQRSDPCLWNVGNRRHPKATMGTQGVSQASTSNSSEQSSCHAHASAFHNPVHVSLQRFRSVIRNPGNECAYPVPVDAAFVARTMAACREAAHHPQADIQTLFIRIPYYPGIFGPGAHGMPRVDHSQLASHPSGGETSLQGFTQGQHHQPCRQELFDGDAPGDCNDREARPKGVRSLRSAMSGHYAHQGLSAFSAGGSRSSVPASGNEITNVAPRPISLSTSIAPSCASTSDATIESPNPLPPPLRDLAGSLARIARRCASDLPC